MFCRRLVDMPRPAGPRRAATRTALSRLTQPQAALACLQDAAGGLRRRSRLAGLRARAPACGQGAAYVRIAQRFRDVVDARAPAAHRRLRHLRETARREWSVEVFGVPPRCAGHARGDTVPGTSRLGVYGSRCSAGRAPTRRETPSRPEPARRTAAPVPAQVGVALEEMPILLERRATARRIDDHDIKSICSKATIFCFIRLRALVQTRRQCTWSAPQHCTLAGGRDYSAPVASEHADGGGV